MSNAAGCALRAGLPLDNVASFGCSIHTTARAIVVKCLVRGVLSMLSEDVLLGALLVKTAQRSFITWVTPGSRVSAPCKVKPLQKNALRACKTGHRTHVEADRVIESSTLCFFPLPTWREVNLGKLGSRSTPENKASENPQNWFAGGKSKKWVGSQTREDPTSFLCAAPQPEREAGLSHCAISAVSSWLDRCNCTSKSPLSSLRTNPSVAHSSKLRGNGSTRAFTRAS